MRSCAVTCAHRRFVRDYQIDRARREAQRDAQTLGYQTEGQELPPLPAFKDWLVQHARPTEEEPWRSTTT
jgi:hypothetical protein